MPRPGKRTLHESLDQRTQRAPATVRAVIYARESDPNSKAPPLMSQVAECEKFIERMGWPKPTLGPFLERETGYYHVERRVLDEVERLIQRRQVDVIVALNFERLARQEERRHAARYFARKYGAEYRFAELLPDGKLDESPMAKAYASLLEVFGEMERDKIVARTKRGRAYHAEQGIPWGGRGGAPYGLRNATPDDTPYTHYAREDEEAERLLWMYRRYDEDEQVSIRSLAGELNARGWFTREGRRWTTQTVKEKLTNPRYCGRGKVNRWVVTREPKTYEHSGETYDVRVVRERDEKETVDFAANSEPVLIPPDLFDRVQAKLQTGSDNAGRLGRIGSAHPVEATLLHGPFIVCAHCRNQMVRAWPHTDTKKRADDPIPYYRCGTRGRDPSHPCAIHMINAREVDALVLRLLAHAITDPEQTLKLADTADAHARRAAAEAERAAVHLDGWREQLREIEQDRKRYERVINLLDEEKDAPDVEEYRAKLAVLDERRQRIEREAHATAPAHERAQMRELLLHGLRRGGLLFGWFDTPDGRPSDDMSKFHPIREMKVWTAREWLGLPTLGELYNKRRAAAGLDTLEDGVAEWQAQQELVTEYDMTTDDDPDAEPIVEGSDTVSMADVAYYLLRHVMPHAEVRKLLRNLRVVVEISRPRSKAERATAGNTPVAKRVALFLLTEERQPGQPVVGLRLTATGGAGVTNGTMFAMPTRSTPAAHRSG